MTPSDTFAQVPVFYVGVVGPGDDSTEEQRALAYDVGFLLARGGHIVVTGGLGGVMEAACRGAQTNGGVTVGLLPQTDRAAANDYVTVAIPTGLGELRNGLVVRASDAVIAVGGSWGTLSEVALALRTGVPVVTLAGWALPEPGDLPAGTPGDAVEMALRAASLRRLTQT